MTNTVTYTPGPWDCDGRTTMYATPDEADEITMIEIRANVTEDGWDTVAFIEAIWPGAEVNARLIAAAPDLLAEAIQLLRNAEYADGRATVLTQDCEALQAAIAKAMTLE